LPPLQGPVLLVLGHNLAVTPDRVVADVAVVLTSLELGRIGPGRRSPGQGMSGWAADAQAGLPPGRIAGSVVVAAAVGRVLVGGREVSRVVRKVRLPGVPRGQRVVGQPAVAGSITSLW